MKRNIVGIVIVFLFGSIAIYGNEGTQRPTRLEISSQSATETGPSDIGTVIRNATQLEAQLRGFDVIPPNGDAQPDFTLEWVYEIVGDTVSTTIVATKRKDGEPMASAEWSGTLTLSLDDEIQRVLSQDIFPFLPTSMPATPRETEKAAEAGEEWALTALAAGDAESSAAAMTKAAEVFRWRIGLSGALYLPLSETATYANTGYGGMVSLDYAFHAGLLTLSPGFTAGAMIFHAEAKNAAEVLLLPFGAEIRIGTALAGSLQPWIFLSGGGALFMLTAEGQSPQTKIVTYAEGGIGTDIFFSPAVGMSAQASFRMIFEGSVTIIHVAPGVGMSFRF